MGPSLAFICSILLFAPLFQSTIGFATSDGRSGHVSTATREGRLAVFDDVWETIEERYYDPAFGGIDWNGSRSNFRRQAAEARGGSELYDVLRRMVASLKDPHTRIYSREEKFDWWSPRFVSVGLSIREIEGVPTVVQVDPKSAPAREGIRPGDQILSVEAVAASSVLRQKLSGQPLATLSRPARFRAVATLLEGEVGSSIKLGWQTKDGKVRSATFRRHLSQRQLGFRISEVRKHLVIEIEAFTRALAIDLGRTLKDKLRGPRGVILDLRENGGGDADAMAEIAAVFVGEGVSLGGFTDRAGATFQLTTHAKPIFAAAPREQTRLPLVVLVSERTSSAAEILAAVLQAHGRARLVGTATCGCVLAIRSRHALPDEGVLDVSEFDYRMSSGSRLEGRGVQPEDLILPLRRDLYAQRDRALEKALEILRNTTNSHLRH